MAKIFDALEKAGYGNAVESENSQDDQPNTGNDHHAPEDSSGKRRKLAKNIDTKLGGKWDERLSIAVKGGGAIQEVFKMLRSRILHPAEGGLPPQTVMITSAVPKEGKSFITANLGISLAYGLDQHALLVDCDLRKPTLGKLFGLDNAAGISEYLSGAADLTSVISKTSVKKLSIITSGQTPMNPAELLSSERMADLVRELKSRYDDRIIVFDSPPMLVAAESGVLAKMVDSIIVVVRQGGAGKAQIQKLLEILEPEKILGCVFNSQEENVMQKLIIKGYDNSYGGYGDYYKQ